MEFNITYINSSSVFSSDPDFYLANCLAAFTNKYAYFILHKMSLRKTTLHNFNTGSFLRVDSINYISHNLTTHLYLNKTNL